MTDTYSAATEREPDEFGNRRKCSFCQVQAQYEVGTETTFLIACRRHLSRAVDWLANESSDMWWKVTVLYAP